MKILMVLFAVVFFAVGAVTLDHVGRYQLNAVYACSIEYTDVERKQRCRLYGRDGFGSLVVLHDSVQARAEFFK